jgi:hypothetical protein
MQPTTSGKPSDSLRPPNHLAFIFSVLSLFSFLVGLYLMARCFEVLIFDGSISYVLAFGLPSLILGAVSVLAMYMAIVAVFSPRHLASLDSRSENVSVLPLIIPELELGYIGANS